MLLLPLLPLVQGESPGNSPRAPTSSGFPTALRMIGKSKMDKAKKAAKAHKDSIKSSPSSSPSTTPSTPLLGQVWSKTKAAATPAPSPSPGWAPPTCDSVHSAFIDLAPCSSPSVYNSGRGAKHQEVERLPLAWPCSRRGRWGRRRRKARRNKEQPVPGK